MPTGNDPRTSRNDHARNQATDPDDPLQLQRLLSDILANRPGAQVECEPDSPLNELAREFFANNWAMCQANLLCKTKILRVVPEPSAALRAFHFELDRPYKRRRSTAAAVELMPGPIRGIISYRTNLFQQPDGVHIAVQVDPQLDYFHPNCVRGRGLICLGDLPSSPFPLPLDLLVENHIYPILTYQNMTPSDALDRDASIYFAFEPHALDGLTPVPPLY